MEGVMKVAGLIETTLLSFLLALWVVWIGLRGLFRLMPVQSNLVTPQAGIPSTSGITDSRARR